MSYDIYLTDPVSGEALEIPQPHFMGGGNQCLYGTNTLWLNITYNYSAIYKRENVFGKEGIRSIYRKTGQQSIPILENAINHLGNETSADYWMPTEGNAKRPLLQLLAMARMRPDGIWKGD